MLFFTWYEEFGFGRIVLKWDTRSSTWAVVLEKE